MHYSPNHLRRQGEFPPRGPSPGYGQQRLILVVEDDEATRSFLADNLAADGFRVVSASSAGEGLRAILPALGAAKLGDIRRSDVQRLVNRMMDEGLEPSTVRNALLPLRAIYRQALALDEVAVNPTHRRPAARGARQARANRLTGGGGPPDRCFAQTRPRRLGHRNVRRSSVR